MKRVAHRALGLLVAVLLSVLALTGIALSAVFLLVSSDAGRGFLIPRIVRAMDEAFAGRVEFTSFSVEPRGGIDLQGLRVIDPDGQLVLSAQRVKLTVDLVRLRSRTVILRLEVDQPSVLLQPAPDGSLSLARAFAPTHPSPQPASSLTGDSIWNLRVERLTIRDGSLRYLTTTGATEWEVKAITIDGRGEYGRAGSQVELKLRSQWIAPVAGVAALDLEGSLRHGALRITRLSASLGQSAVEVVAEGDLQRRSGRVAIVSAQLSGAEVRALASRPLLTGALLGVMYAESNGRTATAAADLHTGATRRGSARVAAAAHWPPGRPEVGFEVALESFDPSQGFAGAPPGSISFTARGRAAGQSLDDLRGSLTLSLKPSQLRGGRVGPGELTASAAAGRYEVGRLALSLPGGAVEGGGRYPLRGDGAGRLAANVQDLAVLVRNLEGLLGKKLPAMAGRVQLSAQVEGTAAAPVARVTVSAPIVTIGNWTAQSLSVSGDLRGPRQSFQGRFEGGAAAISVGQKELRKVLLRASVLGRNVELAFTGFLPDWGEEPVAVQGSAGITPDRQRLLVSALTIAFPGSRFALVRPAEVVLKGPSVDRLELVAGDQRVMLAGGIRGRSLDITAGVEALALGRLPHRLLPSDWQLDGSLSVRAQATGRVVPVAGVNRVRALRASAQIGFAAGRVRGVKGLSVQASLQYDEERQRAALQLDARRAEGGEFSVQGELPVDLAHAPLHTPVQAKVALRSFPVADILRLAASEPTTAGIANLEATLTGTVGAPDMRAQIEFGDLIYGNWGPVSGQAMLEGGARSAKLEAFVDLRGARLLAAEAALPVELSHWLRQPRRAVRDLAVAPLAASVTVPGFDLARAAGMGTLPEELSGSVAGKAVLHGSWRAPRLQASFDLTQGAYQAYTGLGLHVQAKASDTAVELSIRATLQASEVLRLSARFERPLEQLAAGGTVKNAPFKAEVVLPETALEQAEPSFPLTGTVEGHGKIGGTLLSPWVEMELRARGLSFRDSPIGDLDAAAQYARARGRAHAELRAARGGNLKVDLNLDTPLGLDSLHRGKLAAAPAEARLAVSRLDLSILPVLFPGLLHTVQGAVDANIRARGPLSQLRPLGSIQLEAQRVAVVEFGEWTGVVVDASLDEETLRIAKLEAHRGGGSITGELQGRGLSRQEGAELTGKLVSHDLTVSRAGQNLATINLEMALQGRWREGDLQTEVTIPTAVVNLPERSPRPLQSLEIRSDITIGPPPKTGSASASPDTGLPLHARLHLVVPNRFFVKSDSPRMDIELKGDLILEVDHGNLAMTGTVNTIRGHVEPIGGRVFKIDRGRVQFSGGPPKAATLDVTATYDNPNAKVQVTVDGPVTQPKIRMTSQPPLEESQIALLIATGRTELKANSGSVGTLGAEDASRAALGAVASQLFRDLVASKLPVDSVAVEPSQLRAGRYFGDKVYIGYTRRFDVQPQQKGVNQNEMHFEYQFTPRWNLELRYGDAGAGGASLVWQRDY